MREIRVEDAGKWATFKAAWKATSGPQGRFIDPTLYSSERLSRWLPLKFSVGLLYLLWLLVFFNLLFLSIGLEATLTNFWWWEESLVTFFYLCSWPLVLLPWSCADLHKRRKNRLKPKRVIITSSFGLTTLLAAAGVWLWSYNYFWRYGHILYETYSVAGEMATNLGDLLPFLAIIGSVIYAIYLVFGVKALVRDLKTQTLNETHAKHVDDEQTCATSIHLADPEPTLQNRYSQGSAVWYDSSVAEISQHTSITMQSTTGISSSLVSPISVRSSMITSGDSSLLPPYSGRSSATHSPRHSADGSTQYTYLAQLEQAHFR